MAQETQRLGALLEELRQMESDLSRSSSETLPLSRRLESELQRLLDADGYRGWTVEDYKYVAAMRLLIPYFKEQGQ
jgi:hypothetical protein